MQRLVELYMEPWRKYATLSGRALRSEYWMFTLVNTAISLLLGFLDESLGLYSRHIDLGLLGALFGFAVLIPGVAVAVRRLHDSNLSGAWLFIILVPLVGWVVDLINMLRRGTRGANRFGPDPLGRFEPEPATDGGAPYAIESGRFRICPWCRQSNPPGNSVCQWCHKPYRDPRPPA